MENKRIGIQKAIGLNPLGLHLSQESNRYGDAGHKLGLTKEGYWAGRLPDEIWTLIDRYIADKGHKPERFPQEAKLLTYTLEKLQLNPLPKQMINAATSRGSIDFLAKLQGQPEGLPVWTSPHSTLGFTSSWPGLLHPSDAPLFFNSATCSSFGLALLNGMAWLNSAMADHFIAAAVECPTEAFTVDQMKAIRIYALSDVAEDYPCRSMDFEKKLNTMVLGEGAYAFHLTRDTENCLAHILGVGSGMEKIHHSTELSPEGDCIVTAGKSALEMSQTQNIDLIIGHFPGTKLGDLAEHAAYQTLFKSKVPYTLSNKWKIGHSLGSSLAANLDLAIAILQNQRLPEMPAYMDSPSHKPSEINHVLITALGFGGQAICAVISR